jgi:electron transfer flavoprotein alpha subunit
VRELAPTALVATGGDRANEVLAHVAALLDLPFAANVLSVRLSRPMALSRVRWGGSLVEQAELDTALPILSCALHAFSGEPVSGAGADVESVDVELAADAMRTAIVERVEVEAGITLQTAPVVVSGGRGVGSTEGFAALERLAELLGGAVGCSRVVTNQGWRPHSDQVGQTGKRVAPDLYVACGISGAIQHWIGMQAAKHVLAINTDAGAPMVAKADSAVIGDLHEVVPAIVAEIERRRG